MTRLSNTEIDSEEYNYVHNKYNQEDYLEKLQGVDYFEGPKRPMGEWIPVSGCSCTSCEDIRLRYLYNQTARTPETPERTPRSKEAREVSRMEKIYWGDEVWGEWRWMRSQLVKDIITITAVASVGYMAICKKDQILNYAMNFLDSWQNAAQ